MLGLILITVLVGIDILVNYYYIENKGIRLNHTTNWLLRALLGVIVADLFTSNTILNSIAYMFIWWFLFDLVLNVARGKHPAYTGNAVFDQIAKRTIGEFPYFAFKGIIFIFAVGVIIIKMI